jgi:hypothetical protein
LYASFMALGWWAAGLTGFVAVAGALVWYEKRRLHWQARQYGGRHAVR